VNTKRRNWQTCPIVEIERPCCPYCGSEDFNRRTTKQNGDDSTSTPTVCRVCGRHFIVTRQPLNLSESVTWPR